MRWLYTGLQRNRIGRRLCCTHLISCNQGSVTSETGLLALEFARDLHQQRQSPTWQEMLLSTFMVTFARSALRTTPKPRQFTAPTGAINRCNHYYVCCDKSSYQKVVLYGPRHKISRTRHETMKNMARHFVFTLQYNRLDELACYVDLELLNRDLLSAIFLI
jgi:hypothetical protein